MLNSRQTKDASELIKQRQINKDAAKSAFELSLEEYETTKLAVEAKVASPQDLERAASKLESSVAVWAILNGWVLPEE
jgi:hypothetical protein